MTRRNSHLSLAGPKKPPLSERGAGLTRASLAAGSEVAGAGNEPGTASRSESGDPAMDMLTAWVDSIIRDLDGLTRALSAWTEKARRDAQGL